MLPPRSNEAPLLPVVVGLGVLRVTLVTLVTLL